MDMRKTIIDILLATRSLPEGVAADAIVSAIGSGAEQRDRDEEKLITERDHWEDLATTLALRVGEHFDIDVGEHTSSNCPVVRAVEIFDLRDDLLRPAPTAQDSKVPEGWQLSLSGGKYLLVAPNGFTMKVPVSSANIHRKSNYSTIALLLRDMLCVDPVPEDK